MSDLAPLLGRTLVIVAHPDDEAGGCGVLMQRVRDPVVLITTDGAPRDQYFWGKYGSRDAYAQLRREEARKAATVVGVRQLEFLVSLRTQQAFVDQELFRALPDALTALLEVVDRVRPEALLTLAYEGGHPDHDCCSFLTHVAARLRLVTAWEMPLYHRSLDGVSVQQEYGVVGDREIILQPTEAELALKQKMLAAYASQREILALFASPVERFRLQPAYDYAQPPHSGTLNYEAWGWSISGREVSAAFVECLRTLPVSTARRP
jgi:LmbE family N-acetylglucosaminyl deacetylase